MNKHLHICITLVLFAFLAGKSFGQTPSTANYTFATGTGYYGKAPASNSGGTAVSAATQLIAASQSSVASAVTNIGFDFFFQGSYYSQFSVNTNGLLQLGGTAIAGTTTTFPSSTQSLIAPFTGAGLKTSSTGKVQYSTVGSAPNRILVVEWLNMNLDNTSTTTDGTFQLRLYETTGAIEFVYGAMNLGSAATVTTTYKIGFSSNTTSNKYANITTSANTVSTTAAATNTYTKGAAITNLNSSADPNRRYYLFTPPTPAAPTSVFYTPVYGIKLTINWTDNASNEAGYAIYKSTDNVTYTYLGSAAANATSYGVTGLTQASNYYFKVYAFSEGGLSGAGAGGLVTTAGGLSGTVPIGVSSPVSLSSYSTLTAALADIALYGLTSSATLELQTTYSSASETFPLTISSPNTTVSKTLTIKPAAGASPIISGSSSSAIIILDGASYVTIDGSNSVGGTTQDLTIKNTDNSGTAAVVWGQTSATSAASTNNTIKNCKIQGSGSNSTLVGLGFGGTGIAVDAAGSTAAGNGNNSNTIKNNNILAAQYGIFSAGTSAANPNTGNLITGNQISTASPYNTQYAAIYVYWEKGITISGNTIDNVSTSTANDVVGIALGTVSVSSAQLSASDGGDVTNATVSGNIIGKVLSLGSNGYSAVGIYVSFVSPSAAITNTISNNVITGVLAYPTSPDICAGILVGGGTATNPTTLIYYNSVSMSGTVAGTTTEPTFAFAIASGINNNINIRNNAFSNTQTGGTGYFAVMGINYASTYSKLTFNYNNYYVTGTNGVIGIYNNISSSGGTNAVTFTTWKTATATSVSGNRDANSLNVNPGWNGTTNLVPYASSGIVAKGVNISTFTTDVTGATRSATTPSIGAYETGKDQTGPVISYTNIPNVNPSGTYSVTGVAITDAGTGVATGTNAPVLWYKKSTDANVYIGNTSSDNGWKYVQTSGTTSPFTFTLDFGLLRSTPVQGDVIQYFFTAQDLNSTANLSASPSTGFIGTSVLSWTLAPNTPSSFLIVNPPLAGDYLVGTGQTYTTLTAALTDLSLRGVSAATRFLLTNSSYTSPSETFPLTVSSFSNSGNYTVTIKPNTGVTTSITGTSTSGIFVLKGADYLVIDGSNTSNGTSRDLTIKNSSTSVTSSVIQIVSASASDGATNNKVLNTILNGKDSSKTKAGVFIGGGNAGTAALTANSNNTIQNNLIGKTQIGVYILGNSTTTLDAGNVIQSNAIGSSVLSLNTAGVVIENQQSAIITGNTIQYVQGNGGLLDLSGTSTVMSGINVRNSKSTVVSANLVGNLSYTDVNNYNVLFGICTDNVAFNTSGTASNTVLWNNSVYNLLYAGGGFYWGLSGINLGSGYGEKLYYNSVSLTGAVTTYDLYCAAFSNGNDDNNNAATAINAQNNAFTINATGASDFCFLYSEYMYWVSSLTGTTLNYNDLYVATDNANNTINLGNYNGTDYATIATWRTATGQEAKSINVTPGFNTSTDLRPTAASGLLTKGITIASYTTDAYGVTRSATTPTIGFAETGGDYLPPTISYTPLQNNSGTSTYSTGAIFTITDASNVSTTSLPRLYYKKSTEANTFGGNTSASNGWKYVTSTGTTSPYTFVIDYSLLNSTATTGTTIQYFVVAQDLSANANVGSNPSTGFAGTSVGSISTAPSTPYSYVISTTPLSGTYYIGASQTSPNYSTLTAAFADLSYRGVSAATTFYLTDSKYGTSETFPLTITNFPNTSSVAVTIKPNTGVFPTISGSNEGPLVLLKGADKVTFDGSNQSGGTSQDMTIYNTNTSNPTAAAVIWVATNGTGPDAASSNTFKNLIIKGSGSTLAGIGSGSSAVSVPSYGTLNITNTYSNNVIDYVQYGIYTAGKSTTSLNTGTSITNNLIGTMASQSIQIAGIFAQYESGITVTGNTITNVYDQNYVDVYGIVFGNNSASSSTLTSGGDVLGTNTIAQNYIYSVNGSNSYSAIGISLGKVASGTNNVYNNVVTGITGNPTGTSFNAGIYANGGGTTKIDNNTVVLSGARTGATGNSYCVAIANTNPTCSLYNNILHNSATVAKNYAVGLAYTTTYTKLYSLYNDLYTANSATLGVTGGLSGSGTDRTFATWKSTAPVKDATNSINTALTFNSATVLASTTTAVSGIGLKITSPSITKDILGNTRATGTSPSGPTIGAYEKTGDLLAPTITYTAIPNTLYTSSVVLSATISDASGIGTGTLLPRLYYKKSTDNNAFAANTSAGNGWKYVLGALVSGSTYSFTINYSLLQTTAAAGDVIQYFVAAQDAATVPNVALLPTSYNARQTTTVNAAITTINAAPVVPNSYKAIGAPLAGTYYIGASQTSPNYTTITKAVSDLVDRGVSAAVTFLLTDATYSSSETFPITISKFTNASNFAVTIRPNTNVASTITGSSASSIFVLDGVSYITIDGSNTGGTSRDLTIKNTDAGDANTGVIWLQTSAAAVAATNNKIKNILLQGYSGNTTFGIGMGGTTQSTTSTGTANNTNTFQNNVIDYVSIGIYSSGASAASQNTGNIFTQNQIGTSASGSIGQAGIVLAFENTVQVTSNKIDNVTSSNYNDVFGILLGGSLTGFSSSSTFSGNAVTNATVSGNYVGTVSTTSNSLTAIGLAVAAVTLGTTTIYNNVITGVTSDATPNDLTAGIYLGGGGTTTLYYNSVSMTGARGFASSPSFALAIAGTNPTVTLTDNLFYNAQTATSGGVSYAIGLGYSTTYTGLTSNYNNLYSVTAASTGSTGSLSSPTSRTFATWKSTTGKDANSLNVNPSFNGLTNLIPQTGSSVLAGGTPVSGITTDYKGVTRSATTPSMGAYENGGDGLPPTITVATINNLVASATASTTATITDPSGIGSGANLPRLYYKKSTDNNTFGGNTSATNGWKYVLASNTSSPYSFTLNYSLLQTLPVKGETIQYFVAAQDAATNPNVGSGPVSSLFTATGITSVTAAPANPYSYLIVDVPLAGTYYVGASQTSPNYKTITSAVADLSLRGVSATTNFVLTDASFNSETYPITIGNFGNTGNSRVTLKPNTGISPNLSTATASALFILDGADYITIDGSNAGTTTQNLSLTNNNTSTTSAGIWIQTSSAGNAATNNIIKNLNVSGSGTTNTFAGIGIAGTNIDNSSTGNQNNNNTLQNNSINNVQYGIYTSGASALLPNSGTSITGNQIDANIGNGAIYVNYENNISITGNTIDDVTDANNGGFGNDVIGISLGIGSVTNSTTTGNDVTNATVSGNNIGTVSSLTTYSAIGIAVGAVATGTNTIYNNQITGVYSDGTGGDFAAGIFSGGGTGATKIYFNSVSMSGSTMTDGSENSYAVAINGTDPVIDVRNNILSNTQTSGSGTSYAIGLGSSTQVNATLDYNLYYSTSGFLAANSDLGNGLTADYATITDWQTATGKEASSFSTTPNFTSTTDLHIASGTNCTLKGRGTPITGITLDYDGQTRSATNPDIGFDEFLATGVAGTWTGITSSDWNTTTNWCNGSVPTSSTDVTIPGSTPYQPVISSGTATCNTLNISSGGSITVSGTGVLNITGSLVKSSGATLTQTGGTINFSGTSSQTISAPSAVSFYSLGISGNSTKSTSVPLTIGNSLTINSGTFTDNGKTITLNGNLTNNGTHTSGSGGSLTFSGGTAAHSVSGTGTFANLILNDAFGVNQTSNVTLAGSLTLTSGIWTTGSYTLTLPTGSTFTGAGTGKYINGNLAKYLAVGASQSLSFEIGSASGYAPLSLTFANVTTAGYITASTSGSDHPQISTSCLNGAKSANRYWSTSTSSAVFGSYTATTTFNASDMDAGATATNFYQQLYNGSAWVNVGVSSATATTTTNTGYTVLGDLQNGENNFVTPAVSVSITTGSNPSCTGSSLVFTATPTNGGTSPTYQWTKNGTNIAGATSSTWSAVAGTDFVNGDLIRVVLTSNVKCAGTPTGTSTPVTLTVNALPSVPTLDQISGAQVCSGNLVSITNTAGCTGCTYLWSDGSTNTTHAVATGVQSLSVTVTNANGCKASTSTIALTGLVAGTWLGTNTVWSNASNWCGGVPTSTQDVFIPSGASNMPALGTTATCHDLNIASGATFTLNSGSTLKIYGAVNNSGSIVAGTGSKYELDGTSAQTLPTFTVYDLVINNAAGVTLNGDLTVNHTLTLTSGDILTGTNKVSFGTSATDPIETPTSKIQGLSEMQTRNVGTGNLQFLGVGITGTDNVGTIYILRTTGPDGIATGMTGKTGIATKWHIDAGVQPSTNGRTLTLSWLDVWSNGRTPSNLQVYTKETTTNWGRKGSIQTAPLASFMRSVSVVTTAFSDWTISDGSSPLPITLVSLNAIRKGKMVEVLWATATELNDNRFEILRSTDQKTWQKVGERAIDGNSNSVKNYNLLDSTVQLDKTRQLYYKLRVIDQDGSEWTSDAVAVSNYLTGLVAISPNPFKDELYLKLPNSDGGEANLTLTDALGRTLQTKSIVTEKGQFVVPISEMVSGLDPNIYNVSVTYNGQVSVHRIVKQ